MRYAEPKRMGFHSMRTSGTLDSNQDQLSKAIQKVAKRTFYCQAKSLNRMSQYSIPNEQLKSISHRTFSTVSRLRPKTSNNVISVIKGKPHCVKLGATDGETTGFDELFDCFYSNIYSDRLPGRIKNAIDPNTRKQSQAGSQLWNPKMKIRPRMMKRRPKYLDITDRVNAKEYNHSKSIASIIKGCNKLLQVPVEKAVLNTLHRYKHI